MTIPYKYSPYIFIAILAVVTTGFGYLILPNLPWYVYVLSVIGRFLFMSAIWQLIRLVNKKLEKRFTLERQPGLQILLQVIVTLVLLSPVFLVSFLFGRNYWATHGQPPNFSEWLLPLGAIMFIVIIMMMTFGYYAYDLFVKYRISSQEKSKLALEAAQLENEKAMMRFHHLKNQINPHFLFNTLSSLDGLIQSNPLLASEFVRHLAKVYRYVLEHKENEVVSLETEVNFIQHYISLLQIRNKDAIRIRLDISEEGMEKGIVMVTLQMLIDNAIKHNIVQTDMPLSICIWDEDHYLHIHNNKQLRKQMAPSSKQGLNHLTELYAYLTDRPVEIKDEPESFEINLPLL